MADDTIKVSSFMSHESQETHEGIMRETILDPLGDVPQEVVQAEIDKNPQILASIAEELA